MENQDFGYIKELTDSAPVVLFMKGTKEIPQCGFSAFTVAVLRQAGAEFKDINVLENEDIRQGIKDYSDWPTIPQLYIKGEFIGGCDIVKEMYGSGELQKILKDKGAL